MKNLTVFPDDLVAESEIFSMAPETPASGSTGILLSTLWNQSGVIRIGTNRTVTYNEYTPLDPKTGTHSVTGCTNTAAAQLIHYFIEGKQLDLSLVLNDGDAYTNFYREDITVKSDGSTPGTISFAAVNNLLVNYSVTSAECAAALLYACGVVQHASYSAKTTITAWDESLFYRAGFLSVGRFYEYDKAKKSHWGTSDEEGHFTISDAGFEVLIENLQAGLPVGTGYPGHALVIDGYDEVNDLFHINFGWGNSASTRWYSREEMRQQGYHDFLYDLYTERIETLTVTDSRIYGTGTMVRAFEMAASFKGGNTVVFSTAVGGGEVVLNDYIGVRDDTTIRDFNMTVTVNDPDNHVWCVGFYAESSGVTVFENFGGTMIVNSDKEINAVMDFSQGSGFSFSGENALLYAGRYNVNGDYFSGAAKVLSAMRTAHENGTAVDSFVTAAATDAFCFHGTSGNDSVTVADNSLVVGKTELRDGDDVMTVKGNSRVYGTVCLNIGDDTFSVTEKSQLSGSVSCNDGDDVVIISDSARILGNIYLEAGNDKLTLSGGSCLDGDIFGNDGDDVLTVCGTSTVSGILHFDYGDDALTVSDGSQVNTASMHFDDGNDSLTITENSAVSGISYLNEGDDQVTVSGNSQLFGNVYLGSGNDKLTITDNSQVQGDVHINEGSDTVSVTQRSRLCGSIYGLEPCAITIDSSSTIEGMLHARSDFRFVLNSAAEKHALSRIDKNVFNIASVSVDIADASVGSYVLFAAGEEVTDAGLLDQIKVAISGGGRDDYTLCVNDTAVSDLADLSVEDRMLKLYVKIAMPKVISVTADITDVTYQDVTVEATFSENATITQYSRDGNLWQNYSSEGVRMTENGTVYFRGIDADGNISKVTSYDVSNIDKVAPGKPTATANTTAPTNGNVTVTATFSGDSAQKQYSFDGTTWSTYTTGVVMTANGTVYFRGIDAAGNVSEVTTYEVSNITAAPEKSVAADLNGDGRADIVMTITQPGHGAEGATGAWLIQSDQTAAWGDLSTLNPGWEIFGMGVTTAGKSTNDVYIRNTDNIIGAWATGDSGEVTNWVTVGQFDADTQILGLGDFNGNGQTDLLLRNVNGAVGCFFTGGETTGWNYFQSLGDEWKICAVGDLNGDGRDDLVLKHDAGFAGSWLTQSNGTMAWADLDTLPDGFSIVGAGDFDGDGTDDVLLKTGNYYGAWLVGDGSAKAWFGLGDLGDVTVEQVSDFDGDGVDDLRVRTSAGDLGSLLVRGEGDLEWHYYGSVGTEWNTRLAAI